GYVERVAGVGTFVADLQSASHVLEVRNIADEIARRGHRHTATVLTQTREEATDAVAGSLRIDRRAPVFHLLLVHRENDVPIQLEDRYVVASFAPDCLKQDFCRETPSAWLSAIAPLQEAEHRVRAAMPDEEIRKQLQLEEREPCLVVIRRTWSNGQPVSFARLYHPGSRFELTGHYTPPGIRKRTAENAP
ncbi:MAG TPA: UTRA domain-containing protein, partial [Woeseiaceae bacterium]|nr:UTRA domain-containing protein [Woeseiaceae bacterium]